MSEPDRRVCAYTPSGNYAGFVRLSHDDIGGVIGEVYDDAANKLGAVRVEPQVTNMDISRVFDQDGAQIGYVQLESNEDQTLSASIFWTGGDEEEAERIAYLRALAPENDELTVRRRAAWGEELGVLKPQEMEGNDIALLGGGAALLIFL